MTPVFGCVVFIFLPFSTDSTQFRTGFGLSQPLRQAPGRGGVPFLRRSDHSIAIHLAAPVNNFLKKSDSPSADSPR